MNGIVLSVMVFLGTHYWILWAVVGGIAAGVGGWYWWGRRWGMAGAAVGVLVGGFGSALWEIWWAEGLGPGARAMVVQTMVLAITAGFVVWYACEAKRAADAGEKLVNATLIGHTGLFVTDPIWTVKEYPNHLNEHSGRGRTDNGEAGSIPAMDHIKEHWLAIEIVNEGASRAVNITLRAEWLPCPSDEEGRGDMQPTPGCKAEIVPTVQKLNKEIGGLKDMGLRLKMWRRWDLASGESVLACVEAPCKGVSDDQRKLVLRWHDATCDGRERVIPVHTQKQRHKEQGKWTTDWNKVEAGVGPFDE